MKVLVFHLLSTIDKKLKLHHLLKEFAFYSSFFCHLVHVEKGSEYAITFSAARTCAAQLNVSVLGGV
jgi:hypothetical protein